MSGIDGRILDPVARSAAQCEARRIAREARMMASLPPPINNEDHDISGLESLDYEERDENRGPSVVDDEPEVAFNNDPGFLENEATPPVKSASHSQRTATGTSQPSNVWFYSYFHFLANIRSY